MPVIMEDEKAMDKPRISFLTDRLYIRSVEESDKEDEDIWIDGP